MVSVSYSAQIGFKMVDKHIAFIKSKLLPLVLISVLPLFFLGGPDNFSSRSFRAFWDLGHLFFFALLTFSLYPLVRRRKSSFWVKGMLVIGICLALGAMIECLQYFVRRTPNVQDIVRDGVGGMIGIFFLMPERKSVQRKVLLAFQALTVCLAGLQVYPVIVALADEYIEYEQFPVLSSFETPWEITRWNGNVRYAIDKRVHLDGETSLRVQLDTQTYPGVKLRYFNGNWETARKFQFAVYNPSTEILLLGCRIHDKKHEKLPQQKYSDRFNRRFALKKGWNTIEIEIEDIRTAPQSRPMDLHHIQEIGFFATRLPHPRVIFIDAVRLVF